MSGERPPIERPARPGAAPRCPTCGQPLPASMTGRPGPRPHRHGRPAFAPLWSPGPSSPTPDARGLLR